MFYRKERKELKSEISILRNNVTLINREKKELNENLISKDKEIKQLNKIIDYKDEQIFKASENIVMLLDKNKKLSGANGGLTAQNNILKSKVKDLEVKLKESMTDKYLVRKIKSEKPKKQEIKMKTRKYNSQVERILIEKNTKEESV